MVSYTLNSVLLKKDIPMIKNYELLAAFIAGGIFLAALFTLAGCLYVNAVIDDFNDKPLVYKKPIYKLKAGKNAKHVVDDFTDGFLSYQVLRVYLHNHQELTQIQKGEYLIDGKKSLRDLLKDMVAGNIVQKEYPVFAIIEGSNIAKIKAKAKKRNASDSLYSSLVSNPQEFMKKALEAHSELLDFIGGPKDTLEGLIYPATYPMYDKNPLFKMFSLGMTRQLNYLFSEWDRREKSDIIATPYDALILASLIEKETFIDEERGLISAVFYNRLKIGMRLQTDPAVMYGVSKNFTGRLTKEHLKRDTPYNTYTRAGLPPSPICMPRESSIYAALHPDSTKAIYFVAKTESPRDGHVFSATLAEHNSAVAAYRKRIKEYKKCRAGIEDEDLCAQDADSTAAADDQGSLASNANKSAEKDKSVSKKHHK